MKKSIIVLITLLIMFMVATSVGAENEKKEKEDMFIIIAQDEFKGEPSVECRMNISEHGRRLVINSYSGEHKEDQLIQTIILSKSGGKGTIISYHNKEKDRASVETYNIFENWCLPYFKEGPAPEEIKEFIDLFYNHNDKPKLKAVLQDSKDPTPDRQEKSEDLTLTGQFEI